MKGKQQTFEEDKENESKKSISNDNKLKNKLMKHNPNHPCSHLLLSLCIGFYPFCLCLCLCCFVSLFPLCLIYKVRVETEEKGWERERDAIGKNQSKRETPYSALSLFCFLVP